MTHFRRIAAFMTAVAVTAILHAEDAPPAAQLVEKENVVEGQMPGTEWKNIVVGQKLAVKDKVRTGEFSRAVLKLADRSVMRLDEFTTFELGQPASGGKSSVEIKQGGAYFFSREKENELEIRTPAANGALRGTEGLVRVSPGKTQMNVFEGEVQLSNAHGAVTLGPGEQGEAEIGRPPRKTASIEAVNLLQWVLYYPAVLDVQEIGLSENESRAVRASLAAYAEGDLLGALEKYPVSHHPVDGSGRIYRAAVLLAVGRVDEAKAIMNQVRGTSAGRLALEKMIAAVKFQEWERGPQNPSSASEWLAESYYQQSRSHLTSALDAARKAVELAPHFGYGWVRVAELEFSFGRIQPALIALERGIARTPRNAQAHALRGFLHNAQNRPREALVDFERALHLDGALGNAWLGRGLTFFRMGMTAPGRSDMQTATAVEPTHSIFHSYLGKAFSLMGENRTARKDLERAMEIDPKDPTPWLYSAIQSKQENRYNEAISELEKSIALNDNRRVYRSQFLLDQDRAIRSSNLAAIYQNNGMADVSVREATRAVNDDYASAPAHLFLANSFNALRDPRRILLRYETPWFNELLLANLLSPVGGGPLSQYVSEQEYSKLFESDGLGISSLTEYLSTGEVRETASQYGLFGNLSYALDAEYHYADGIRPNNRLDRFESYATLKLQLTPQDNLFFQVKYQDLENGDVFQYYDPEAVFSEKKVTVPDATGETRTRVVRNRAALTYDFQELQEPGLILAGYHREWSPGNHTILLFGRLASHQTVTSERTRQLVVSREIHSSFSEAGFDPSQPLANSRLRNTLRDLTGTGRVTSVSNLESNGITDLGLDSGYQSEFEIYSGELNQILTLEDHTVVLGARIQAGDFEARHQFTLAPNPISGLFLDPASKQQISVPFERVTGYAYDFWNVTPWLSLIGGVSYDRMDYPDNFRDPPLDEKQRTIEQVSPKAGFTLQFTPSLILRGAYSQSIGGVSFDESIRLEPVQIAGFPQVSRTFISENAVGSVAGPQYETFGLSLEQKLPSRTYWGLEYQYITQDLDRTIGVFDFLTDPAHPSVKGVLPSSLEEGLSYREQNFVGTFNQLIGDRWSFGIRYQYTSAELKERFRGISKSVFSGADSKRSSVLHDLTFFTVYNHPSGFFARGEAAWYGQENDGFGKGTNSTGAHPGDDFWQFNLYAGWRFHRNQCEISCGFLNITGRDYQLEPLNYYAELPRDRTLLVRAKFSF